ncbi:MAG: glutathione synthetase [Rickettsiales bacterium]|jgi:glutathione synthase|nr:glutathione synthetase [Rickettsiales bacterium]
MSLTVAIQMDPIASIDFERDTTLLLALEAQARGHKLYYYTPKELSLREGVVSARARPLTVRYEKGNHYTLGEPTILDLKKDVDIILLRQDPPFDMRYITSTHLLERVCKETLVMNNPAEVRNAPEKLLVCDFPDLMAPTLVSEDEATIRAFAEEHGDVIIKPLYGFAGLDVFRLAPGDSNLGSLLEIFGRTHNCPLMVQRYIPEIQTQGDKRIVLIEGEPVGMLTRIPKEQEVRSNLRAGGTAAHTAMTERDWEICKRIGPELKKRGLLFVGIDVIGPYITEINVTSPTGVPSINRLENKKLEVQIWDKMEARHKASYSPKQKRS